MDEVADPDDDAPAPVGATMEGSSLTIVVGGGGPRRSDASPGNNTSGDTTPGDTEHADALYGPDYLREALATAASMRTRRRRSSSRTQVTWQRNGWLTTEVDVARGY